MSDNIDYDELDKAVNEAIRSRAAAKPAAKSVVKKTTPSSANVVRKTTTQPTPRPVNHGYYMDFVAKRPLSAHRPVAPVTKPVAPKPVARPVMQPHPVHSAVRPDVVRPVARPVARLVAEVRRPVAPKATAPAVRPSVAKQIQQKQQVVQAKATPTPTPAKPVAPKPVAKAEPKAPNANNYSLGGRSPFMINTKVDKRPLGTNIPETSARTIHSTRNTYSQKDPSTKKHKAKKHMVTESPKNHSGWFWTFIVLLVIAAGAGLGYLAYILVFAN